MLADVVGQDAAVQALRRVAEGRSSSPILLIGDDGVGRRFAFMQLAKEITCSGTRASGCTCVDCEQIDLWSHPDVVSIPVRDAKTTAVKEIPIDQVRWLIGESYDYPSVAPYRLLLIDGADLMSAKTADVLLKTIEEPAAAARFFLIARHEKRVPRTIRSRCHMVRFRALPEAFVLTRVSETQTDRTKALVYARMGEGSVGRSIALAGGGKLVQRDSVFSLIEAGLRRDLPSIFSVLETLKADLTLVLRILGQLIHDVLMAPHSPASLIHIDLTERVQVAGQKAGVGTWRKLADGVQDLTAKSMVPGLNLQFHIQTLFVETFLGA